MSNEKVLSPLMKPKRDAWLDNIKGILMILVVVGHAIASICDDYKDMLWLYNAINFFHMGTFFIVSGYLSKRRVAQRDWISLINRNIVPYILAQFLLYFVAALVKYGFKASSIDSFMSSSSFSLFQPIYQLWYLMAMILFVILCMVGQPQKHPILWLIGSIIVSLGVGYFQQIMILRITKAAAFLPFFIIGIILPDNFLGFLKRFRKLLAIPALAIFALYGLIVIQQKDTLLAKLGSASSAYKVMAKSYPGIDPLLQRAIFLGGVIVLAFAFYVLIPRRRTFFTFIGENSLYVFILHSILVIIPIRVLNYQYHWMDNLSQIWMRLLFVLGAIVATFVLASPPIRKIFRPILEPPFDLRKIVGRLYDEYQARKNK